MNLKQLKPNLLLTLIFLACTGIAMTAQSAEVEYRRSSLSMILIESESFPNKECVMSSWDNYPMPDKYNEHSIDTKSFNISQMELSESDLMEAGFLTDTLKTPFEHLKATAKLKELRYVNEDKSYAVIVPSEKEIFQIKIDKVINSQKLANQVVASWFNRSDDGKFDMSEIQKRGFYNASELEAAIAEGQSRGTAVLGDAGEELIKNTFVTFSKLDFVENEIIANEIRIIAKEELAKNMEGQPQFMIDKANEGIDAVYERTKEGYSLWSKTWLYQLNWNDSIAGVFYDELWSNPSAFDESDLFTLNFVGVQYNQSLVTFKFGEKRTEEQVIDLTLVRNIDKAFAELQKENEVFRPKVPVQTAAPITAQIGMKEGLSGGETFDVLEMRIDSKTGLTEYKTIGSAKVDKNHIWDNRYNAGEEKEPALDKEGNPITSTLFKGSKKIQPGMLLKLVK